MLSNGHVTDDVTLPRKVPGGSTVGYPSDSLTSVCEFCDVHDVRLRAPRAVYLEEEAKLSLG